MIKYSALIFVLMAGLSFSQQFLEKVSSKIFLLNETQINLSKNGFSIEGKEGSDFNQTISGVKIFSSSPRKEYFFIANFNFPSGKTDYPVTIFVFDKESNLLYIHEINASFDMPHPIFSLNDKGILGWLDLLSLKIETFNGESVESFSLEKDAGFEMERSAYFKLTNNFAFVLATIKPPAIHLNEQFIYLYKINLMNGRQQKIKPDITSISLLENIDGNILVSGIKFDNTLPKPLTIVYDENLKEKIMINNAMEQLIKIEDKYFTKFSNSISVFDMEFTLVDKYNFEDIERVKELEEFKGDLIAATERKEENFLYRFDKKFNIENKVRLDIFGFNQVEGLDSDNDKLIIRMPNNSIILN